MIENLAGAFENCGQRCAIAVLSATPGPPCERFRTVHCLDRRSFFDVRAVRRLHKLCQEEQIDIIHSHDAASQALAAVLKLRHPHTTPPILMTHHRSLDIGSTTRRDQLRNRLCCAWTGPVVAVSEERRQHYIHRNRVNARRVVCIPNGTDIERFHPCETNRATVRQQLRIRPTDIVIGACGHFGYEKGLDVVLQTFRRLLDSIKNSSLKLLILGNGCSQRRALLEDLANGCEGRVAFLGYRADVHRLFQAFDIFLHAPRQEAFGLVVTEAMATGVPVVATRVGGIPEIIDDGITGRLTATESPTQLADAVRELIDSPSMRAEMGKQARDAVRQRFIVQLQARRYLDLYEQLAATSSRRSNSAVGKDVAAARSPEVVSNGVLPANERKLQTRQTGVSP
jgi:glycosyltransferase involved in cell wall biosynthesis